MIGQISEDPRSFESTGLTGMSSCTPVRFLVSVGRLQDLEAASEVFIDVHDASRVVQLANERVD